MSKNVGFDLLLLGKMSPPLKSRRGAEEKRKVSKRKIMRVYSPPCPPLASGCNSVTQLHHLQRVYALNLNLALERVSWFHHRSHNSN